MASDYSVAVIGASGTTGNEIIRILKERAFPIRSLKPLESEISIGRSVEYANDDMPVQVLDKDSFKGIDICFFAADSPTSSVYAPIAVEQGCVVIDSTPFYRMYKDVPLVVPEVNADKIKGHRGIIASPGSMAIQLVVPLYPIHRLFSLKRIVVSTYQAVSETGPGAMDELTDQIRALFCFNEPAVKVYPYQIAFNALPHTDTFLDNAYTAEEMSITDETKKILDDDSITICATTVRIPVFYSHAESVNFETDKKITPQDVREVLGNAPGVKIEDDPSKNIYPLPIYASGKDECFVGRIRQDISSDNGIAMWIVADNIRKGAALNAVQIAENLISISEK